MKTIMKLGAGLLLAVVPAGAQANPEPAPISHEKCWTGDVTVVNTQNKTLTGEHWQFSKTFYLGEKCPISTVDNHDATLSDLRPGEKVRIRYRSVEGVLVADRIVEEALHYKGTVQSVDPNTHTLTMAEAPLYQPFHAAERFHIAGDCKVILSNGREGSWNDVQPGDHISVVYELPRGSQVAYRIRERTATFEGLAGTIDLSTRTLEAKEGSSEKQFAVGDHCQVILSGDRTGQLKNVMPGQEYRFTYETGNGINVLDRIAPVPATAAAGTASPG